jgi:GGDEF domain-containing protein
MDRHIQAMSSVAQPRFSLLELPGRSEAEESLRAALAGRRPKFAAVLVAGGVLCASERYGYSAGDAILLEFASCWLSALRPGDRLHRWSGTAFLAVVDRQTGSEGVSAEFQSLAAEPLAGYYRAGGRSLPFLVRTQLTVFPLDGMCSLPALVHSIDYFVASTVS